MMRDDSDDASQWKYKRRGTVLGVWHEIKLQLYHQAMDITRAGQDAGAGAVASQSGGKPALRPADGSEG
jgi:hypothetical protein